MDFRGPRCRGPHPNASFRHRINGGNPNHIPNHNPHQHQVPPRLYPPAMNPAPWNHQNPANSYNAQDEGVNFAQPTYNADAAGYSSYHYPQSLPSPELLNPTPQPQNYPFGQQMYTVYTMDQMGIYQQQPAIMNNPPVPAESVSTRKFPLNTKESALYCCNCRHKNVLAETEIIKREDQIEALQKENQTYAKHTESLMRENETLRFKVNQLQEQLQKLEGSTGPQKYVDVEVSDDTVKLADEGESATDDLKKGKQLSADAMEFSPKTILTSASDVEKAKAAQSTTEVPVVSAKGISEEDRNTPTPVQEIEAGTQVEENLFEETAQIEVSEVPADDVPEAGDTAEEPCSEEPYEDWNEEVDRSANQTESQQESKTEQVKTEVTVEWDENFVPSASATGPEQWRGGSPQVTGPMPDHWQQQRYNNRGNRHRGGTQDRGNYRFGGNRGRDGSVGYGRGNRRNEQDFGYDGNRSNNPHHRNERYNSNQRYSRNNEEYYRDNRQKDNYQKNPRNQRYGDRCEDDQPKQSDEREKSRSREQTEKGAERCDDRNNRTKDNKDSPQKNNLGRDKPNSETKDFKDDRPPTGNFSNNNNRRSYTSKGEPPKVEIPNIVTEQSGDLFSAPNDFSLAHCVAQDFRMGSGIAVKFKNEFKRVGELLDQNVTVGGCAHLEDEGRYIFYLVTKEISTGKPTYDSLEKSLEAMKEKCVKFDVKKLAMPRIGCGLDKLDWSRVKTKINQVFHDTGIDIQVYEWNVEGVSEAEGTRAVQKLPVKYREMNLVDIEKDTALIFLGTENGYMDPTATSLNAKHRFETEYKAADKKIKNVYCFKPKQGNNFDYVFTLIIAKTPKDKVLFSTIEACCFQLSQKLRKEKFQYVGIECPQGWSGDKLFFEKILTLFRATLPKFMELWACFPSAEMDFYKVAKDKDGKDKETPIAK